jgi:23S rRNA pseudouridine2605 synthase
MREGKNREVKNVLGHLGLSVNRLIRLSFGPFQLGELTEGGIEEVRTRHLREQLGERVAALAGADFTAPIVQREAPAAPPPERHSEVRRRGEAQDHDPGPRARGGSRDIEAASRAGTRVRKGEKKSPASRGGGKAPPARKAKRRDERFGEPELARRETRRRHRPGGKRR